MLWILKKVSCDLKTIKINNFSERERESNLWFIPIHVRVTDRGDGRE